MPGETEAAADAAAEKPAEATAKPTDTEIDVTISADAVPAAPAAATEEAGGAGAEKPAEEAAADATAGATAPADGEKDATAGGDSAPAAPTEEAAAAGAEKPAEATAAAAEGAEKDATAGADAVPAAPAAPTEEAADAGAEKPAAPADGAEKDAAEGTDVPAAAPTEESADAGAEKPTEATDVPKEAAEAETDATAGADAVPAAPAAPTEETADAGAEKPTDGPTEATDATKEGAETDPTGTDAVPTAPTEAAEEPAGKAEEEVDPATQEAIDKLSKGVEGVVAEFTDGLEAIPDTGLRSALQNWAEKMNGHVQELKSILSTARGDDPAAAGSEDAHQRMDEEPDRVERESVTEEELQGVRDIGRQLASHRTGRTSEEVTSDWMDPEESAKQVEELRRVRRQIRYIFGGMIQSLPDASSLRVDDLMSDAGTSVAQHGVKAHHQPTEKPPPLPGKPARELAYQKVPVPPQSKPDHGHHAGRPRPGSGGTELSVTDSSAVSWNSQAADDDARRREKKERKSKKHRHYQAEHEVRDVRHGKKDDGALAKPFNWADEVVKASMDPQNQWDFPSNKGGGYAEAPQRAAWEQPRARGPEVASRARERAEEVQRWERQHESHNQQYIFGSPRGF